MIQEITEHEFKNLGLKIYPDYNSTVDFYYNTLKMSVNSYLKIKDMLIPLKMETTLPDRSFSSIEKYKQKLLESLSRLVKITTEGFQYITYDRKDEYDREIIFYKLIERQKISKCSDARTALNVPKHVALEAYEILEKDPDFNKILDKQLNKNKSNSEVTINEYAIVTINDLLKVVVSLEVGSRNFKVLYADTVSKFKYDEQKVNFGISEKEIDDIFESSEKDESKSKKFAKDIINFLQTTVSEFKEDKNHTSCEFWFYGKFHSNVYSRDKYEIAIAYEDFGRVIINKIEYQIHSLDEFKLLLDMLVITRKLKQ